MKKMRKYLFENNKYKYYKKLSLNKSFKIRDSNKNAYSFKYPFKNKFKKKKETQYIKGKIIAKIIMNIISLMLFIVAYYYYYLSIEKCLNGETECSQKWNWIKLKVEQLIISTLIIFFLFALIIYKIISKLHLFHFICTFTSFYYYSHSTLFRDHGGLNLIGLFGALFLSIALLFIIKIFFSIFKLKYKYKILTFISLLLFYNILIDPTNCDDWPKGLNNTYIENDKQKYGCQIKFPKKCVYKIIAFTQDINKITRKDCKNKKQNAREKILKFSKSRYIKKNTIKFGFPLTNIKEGRKDGVDELILLYYTSHNLIDMDAALPPKLSRPEYIVDFSKDPLGELILNINYNETLSIERKKLEKNSVPYSENVLVLYVDSISRTNSLRQLKKTLNFFEQFMPYKGKHNEKFPEENFHSFQFLKYHAFEGYTYLNFPILFYGNTNTAADLVRITKYFKKNGYVTAYASDYCAKDNMRTKHYLPKEEMYDHQLLLCDPNKAGVNDVTKRCLYGELNSKKFYSYIEQFWRKYKNNRKFSLVVINDAHEITSEAIKYSDEVFYNFLNSLYNDNLLKNTAVFLLSDHGSAMSGIYYLYEFFRIEIRLPMLYMIINDRKNVDYNQQYSNIYENQQTFITAYDIYNTFGNIIYGDNYTNIPNKTKHKDTPKSPKGKSLFEKINKKQRTPKLYKDMATHICE